MLDVERQHVPVARCSFHCRLHGAAGSSGGSRTRCTVRRAGGRGGTRRAPCHRSTGVGAGDVQQLRHGTVKIRSCAKVDGLDERALAVGPKDLQQVDHVGGVAGCRVLRQPRRLRVAQHRQVAAQRERLALRASAAAGARAPPAATGHVLVALVRVYLQLLLECFARRGIPQVIRHRGRPAAAPAAATAPRRHRGFGGTAKSKRPAVLLVCMVMGFSLCVGGGGIQ